MATCLRTDGVQVFKCLSDTNVFNHETFIAEQREFIDTTKPLILGGFGAFGNPSSFHHPEVRHIRRLAYNQMFSVFKQEWPTKKVELLFDRFATRYEGTTIGAESWHRDIGIKDSGDVIYGGWINLDPLGSEPHKFSCVPRNILTPTTTGFVKFTKEESSLLKSQRVIYTIPPGHMIVFDQTLAHEIIARRSTFDSHRLYLSYRITSSSLPLYPKEILMHDQGVPQSPGADKKRIPPMWALLHGVFWKDRVDEFCTNLKPQCARRIMPSLRTAGLPLFPPYLQNEKVLYYPQPLHNDTKRQIDDISSSSNDDDDDDDDCIFVKRVCFNTDNNFTFIE